MEIVPTSIPKKKQTGLDDLILRKAELKQQIQDQKQLIASSTQMFSPVSISTSILGSFTKSLNIVDGILVGFKIFRFFRKIFK